MARGICIQLRHMINSTLPSAYPSLMRGRLLRICLLTVACVSVGASHVEHAAGTWGQDALLT
jgi:hypothetical protein